jgi:hypothetical protein
MEDNLQKKWKTTPQKMEEEPIKQINLIGSDTIVNSPSNW